MAVEAAAWRDRGMGGGSSAVAVAASLVAEAVAWQERSIGGVSSVGGVSSAAAA